MKTISNLVSLVLLLIVLVSCNSVRSLINKEFPPLSVKDQQIRAISESNENLTDLSPNVSVHVGGEVLKDLLSSEIEKSALLSSDSNIVIHSFKPKINLAKQAIIVDAEFDVSFIEMDSRLEGKLKGYVSFSSIGDTLFFLPALKDLKVTDVNFLVKRPKLKNRAIAVALTPLTKHFLDNLNGVFLKKRSSIYTGWGENTKVEVGNLFTNSETTVKGPTTTIGRYVKTSSWLIDKSGLSVLLELEKSKSVVDSDFENVDNEEIDLDGSFRKYQTKFAKTWLDKFQPYNDSTKLSVGVTTETFASIFNELLSTSTLHVTNSIDIPKESSVDDLEIERLKVDCDDVREKFSFPDFKYGKNCNYSCMKKIKVRIGPIKITKKIDDPICGAARASCKIARETARIAWQTSRETARIAHQVYNEGKVAACKLAVEASELIDFGKIETSSEGTGKATLELSNLTITDDLSSLKFNTKGDVNLKLKSFLGLYPQDVGHLWMCTVDYKKSITTNLKGNILNQFSEITFNHSKIGDDIILTGEVAPIAFKASVDVSPLHKLLLDGEFAVKCPLLHSTLFVGGVAGGAAALLGMIDDPKLQLLLKGSAVDSYELNPFTQKISPISFKLNDNMEVKSNVNWEGSSIEFRY